MSEDTENEVVKSYGKCIGMVGYTHDPEWKASVIITDANLPEELKGHHPCAIHDWAKDREAWIFWGEKLKSDEQV